MKIPFSSFRDISRSAAGRPLVLWGAGNICDKTLRKLFREPDYVVDNSANMWGAKQGNIDVISPAQMQELLQAPFIVICTTSFREVSEQLETFGLVANKDFIVSPILNDLRIIDHIEEIQLTLLFSSGTQPNESAEHGGGIYQLTVDKTQWHYKKIFSGSCHHMLKVNGDLYTVDDELGLIQFNQDMSVLRHVSLPPGSRGHGLAYHEKTGSFYIACSGADKVIEVSADFNMVRELPLSIKQGADGGPFHHTNDCCIVGDSLYVSMFSETGNWKRDIFDGAVVEFDLISGVKIGTPIRDLWMPHNIQFIDGSLTVLDSLRGNLLRNNAQIMGTFPAFTRGLAYNNELFFIGQSRNRNFSKNLGVSKNISVDTGIVVFDEETKVSRFLQLPSSLSEIHSILHVSNSI